MCECDQPAWVTDQAAGDVVCASCGVVVEAHIFDERPEFCSEPRFGPEQSWLLPDPPVVLDRVPRRRRRMGNADPDAPIRELFRVVDHLGHRFLTHVRDTAKMLCRDLARTRATCRDQHPALAAAALYLAARMDGHGVGRSKRELAADLACHGVTERAITATAKLFRTTLHAQPYAGQLHRCDLLPDHLVNRCVDRLGLPSDRQRALKKAAHELAARLPPDALESRNPGSVCGGVVACAADDLGGMGDEVTRRRLAAAARISAATVEKMAAEVRQWVSRPAEPGIATKCGMPC